MSYIYNRPTAVFKDYSCFKTRYRERLIWNNELVISYWQKIMIFVKLRSYVGSIWKMCSSVTLCNFCSKYDQLDLDGDWPTIYVSYNFSLMMSIQWKYPFALIPLLMQWLLQIFVHAMAACNVKRCEEIGCDLIAGNWIKMKQHFSSLEYQRKYFTKWATLPVLPLEVVWYVVWNKVSSVKLHFSQQRASPLP